MSKDNIKFIKYLCLIFIAVFISYKLPHDSYSIIQYIIKPIKTGDSVITLSGLIPIILIVISIRGILRLDRFANKNKFITILLIIAILIPFMKWTMDFTRTNYHTIRNDGINSIDINKSDISIGRSNNSATINIKLKLRDYSRNHHKFRIRVYLPKTLSEYAGKTCYELDNNYEISGYHNLLYVNEQINIGTANTENADQLLITSWFFEDVKYELYDDNRTVTIIHHGY